MEQSGPRLLASRTRIWRLAATALFIVLMGKLGWVQGIKHAYYRERAQETRGRHWPIPAPRGNIYDRNDTPLALNLKLFTVAVDPFGSNIPDPPGLAAKLAPLLRMPVAELTEKLTWKGSRYVRLREDVDEQVAEEIRKLQCPGILVRQQWKRAYPHGIVAAGLLGFVGTDMKGLSGLEGRLNATLAGSDGEMLVMLDGRLPRSRTLIPGQSMVTKQMIPGSSVFLTIDLTIQAAADAALAKAVESAHAAGGTAIVMDPKTGDILALATQPTFDPNEFAKYDPKSWVSDAVSSPYEPGSTFKAITACAALEEGAFSHGETITCSGTKAIGNRVIGCAVHGGSRGHGVVDLHKMIVKSCNVGLASVALELGSSRLYHWVRELGFGQRTGIELAGESPGLLTPGNQWSQIQLANVGFGQGVGVTPVQLLRAYAAIANGGFMVSPRVVKMVTTAEGEEQYPARPEPTQVLSAGTCAFMQAALQGVVDEGTGRAAAIPGRTVAGKTGTAQKPTPEAGYHSGKYVGSFIGFAPVKDAKLAVIVVIDEPKGSHYGGVVAAPAFKEIMEQGLSYLHVPPDAEPKEEPRGAHESVSAAE
jgi:stage V sporulation protein D (sporulation-specific penicillin-binding protein)